MSNNIIIWFLHRLASLAAYCIDKNNRTDKSKNSYMDMGIHKNKRKGRNNYNYNPLGYFDLLSYTHRKHLN